MTDVEDIVVAIQGNHVKREILGSDQDGYALIWNDSNDNWQSEKLPTSLPPSGSAGGDLSGTYPNPTVVSVAHVTTGVLPAANQASQTLLGDVTGNTGASVVSKISGSNPINITPTALRWLDTTTNPTITQAASTMGIDGGPLQIVAQPGGTSGNRAGGNLLLYGGTPHGTGTPGGAALIEGGGIGASLAVGTASAGPGQDIALNGSSTRSLIAINANTLRFGDSFIPVITQKQAQAPSSAGALMTIQAQAAAIGSNAGGGELDLLAGAIDGTGGGATNGAVFIILSAS